MNGVVKWFVDNPIAANLLMIAMLIGGFFGAQTIKKETWPAWAGNQIEISMAYPGAASSEVEQLIVVRIEEAIANLPGIFQITSESQQGFGYVNVIVTEGFDLRTLLNDIKARVDAISTFPVAVERPIIRQSIWRPTLMWLGLYGDIELRELKRIAFQIRDEMALLEGVSEVVLTGLKNDELSIEISEENLRRYGLSFDEIASAVRQSSLNLPAGAIQSKDGDIQIQTRAQAFDDIDFAKIVVRSNVDGSQLLLSDIGEINDGFAEQNIDFVMNGKTGLDLEVKMSDDPKLFQGTENARAYIKALREHLPDGVTLVINNEYKTQYDSRFNLLKDNALGGLILVFVILMLFLRPQLAFWVVAGIATTFAGALWVLPYLDVSINMLSMFAFLMVLGIVVDDSIIIGESIYRHQQRGELGHESAIGGTRTVLKPVLLSVFSTILFFIPLMGVPSTELIYTRSIFYVVLLCLSFSLLEAVLILPSHLSHMKPEVPSKFYPLQQLTKLRGWFSHQLTSFAENQYQPALTVALRHRASSYLIFFFIFAIAVAVTKMGWITTSFFPNVPMPHIFVNVVLADGTPFSQTQSVANHILRQVDLLKSDPTLLAKNGGKPFIFETNKSINGSSATIFVGLTPEEERTVSAMEVENALRKQIGPLPEAQKYSLNSSMSGNNPDISLNLNLLDNQRQVQQAAVNKITQILSSYPGVLNVRSNLESERTEIEVKLKPYAETLGITLGDIAKQVRQGFYGEEIQRIPRAKEDVRVMLRYQAEERRTLDTLDDLRIRTNDGREIPLEAVADVQLVPGPSTIRRVDRKRNIAITADVEEGIDANAIVTEMLQQYTPEWRREFTGFQLSTDGNLKAQAQFGTEFTNNFLKIFILVFALFAIAFRSFFQPVLVMLAIPFGFVGAVIGHLLFNVDLSMFSGFGFLACSGVVVNDNLVLLERINQLKERGYAVKDAVMQAGVDRFRPILLTSVTTFVGLVPILFERSTQSLFLKPMVVSLAFGVLFSTVVTLFLVPCGYLSGHELRDAFKRWTKKVFKLAHE